MTYSWLIIVTKLEIGKLKKWHYVSWKNNIWVRISTLKTFFQKSTCLLNLPLTFTFLKYFSLNSALHCKNSEAMLTESSCSCSSCLLAFLVCLRIRDGCRWHWHSACSLLKLEGALGRDVTLVETVETHRRFGIVESCVRLGSRPNPRGVTPRCWLWVTVSSVEITVGQLLCCRREKDHSAWLSLVQNRFCHMAFCPCSLFCVW